MCTPQPEFSFRSYPLDEMSFDGAFSLQNCGPLPDLPQSTLTRENHHLHVGQNSISENTPSFADIHFLRYSNQVHHDPGVLPSTHLTHVQMPHNPGLWSPSAVQQVPEVLPSPSSSTVASDAYMSSASYSAYDPDQNAIHRGSHVTSDPPSTLWPTPSDRRPLVDQENDPVLHPFLNQPSVHPFVYSSHMMHPRHPNLSNDENVDEPFTSLRSPPCQSFGPTSPCISPHLTPPGFIDSDPRSHLAVYRAPRLDSTRLSRRRRDARAIEYDGLWIDEEELLKSLAEPSGQLIVHQCRWEEDRSPCHLWIKGDKSCINAHIQKWHGEKPGDKSNANCRWSICGKRMLKESIGRHVLSVHLGATWECQGCGKEIARDDAYGKHAVKSNFEACRTAGALVTYFADTRAIDARTALASGGRLRYAGA